MPSELAVGEGRSGSASPAGADGANATVGVSRMDPDNGRVTGTARLRGDEGGFPVAGTPRLAVGEGAVWAVNPDGSVSRIDPKSGRVVATIETKIRRGRSPRATEGVWYLGFDGERGDRDRHTQEPAGPDDPGRALA